MKRKVLFSIAVASLFALSLPVHAALMTNMNFDQSSVYDSSGHGWHFTAPTTDYGKTTKTYNGGGITYSANGSGKQATFPENQTIQYNYGDKLSLDSFTISFWYQNTAATLGWDHLFTVLGETTSEGNNGQYGLRYHTNPNGSYYIQNGGGGTGTTIPGLGSSSVFPANVQDYNLITMTVADGKMVVYVNGVSKSTSSWSATQDFNWTAFAGAALQTSGDNRGVVGTYDNISVYDRALSASEVSTLYNAGSASTKIYADIYSATISGTQDANLATLLAQNTWSHRFGTSGTVDATSTKPGSYDTLELKTGSSATIELNSSWTTDHPLIFGSKNLTVSVPSGQTVTLNDAAGAGFTKTGAGTLKLTGTENFGTVDSNFGITVSEGVLEITNGAKICNYTWRNQSIKVETGATVRVDYFSNYGGSFGCLHSGYKDRVMDGGKFEILKTSNGYNGFQTTTNGGEISIAKGATVNFTLPGTTSEQNSYYAHLDGTLTISGEGNASFAYYIKGDGGITKNGTGTLTINNSGNTYTGLTTLNAGTLVVNGLIPGDVKVNGGTLKLGTNGKINGQITFESGASVEGLTSLKDLKLNGTVNQTVTLATNDQISPAGSDAVGTLAFDELKISDGSQIVLNVAADGSADFLSGVSGTLKEGSLLFSSEDPTANLGSKVDLIKAKDGVTLGLPADLSTLISPNSTGMYVLDYSNGLLSATLVDANMVPEPATWILLLAGVGILGLFRKK